MSRARRLRTPDGDRCSPCGDLGRVEAGQEAHREQGPVVGLEPGEDSSEVDGIDPVGGIRARRGVEPVADVHDGPDATLTHGLARLVGGDRHEPAAHLGVIPQRRQAAPGDLQASWVASRAVSASPHTA